MKSGKVTDAILKRSVINLIDYKNKNGGVVFSVPVTDISHGH